MKKSLWIVIIVVILIIFGILIFNLSKTKETGEATPSSVTGEPSGAEQDYTELTTDDDIFNAIEKTASLME